jgi:hypothetical protein
VSGLGIGLFGPHWASTPSEPLAVFSENEMKGDQPIKEQRPTGLRAVDETNIDARHGPLCLKLSHGIDHFGRGFIQDMEKGEQDPGSAVEEIDRRKRQLVGPQYWIGVDRESKVYPQIGKTLPDARNAIADRFEVALTRWKRLHRLGNADVLMLRTATKAREAFAPGYL